MKVSPRLQALIKCGGGVGGKPGDEASNEGVYNIIISACQSILA